MPLLAGYTFKGWYEISNDGSKKKIVKIPAKKLSDMTVGAIYKENEYSIIYKNTVPKGYKISDKFKSKKNIKYTETLCLIGNKIEATSKKTNINYLDGLLKMVKKCMI